MADKRGFEGSSGLRWIVITSAIMLSLTAVALVLAWDAAEAMRVQTRIQDTAQGQDVIDLEFVYTGSDLSGATLAAEELSVLLSQQTGLTVGVSLLPCESVVLEHLGSGQADVAMLRPIAYVIGHDLYGMEAELVNGQFGSFTYRSQFNVQATSGYTSLLDLQGTKYLASDPFSISGYYAPYVLISETTGMTPTEFFSEVAFAGGHDQVILEIYTGTADVGTTFDDARALVEPIVPDVYSVVTVLTYTDPLPNDPWVFRTGLAASTVQTLTNGIMAVAGTVDGENALETIIGYDLTGIGVIEDDDFDIYRTIVNEFGMGLFGCNQNFAPIIVKE